MEYNPAGNMKRKRSLHRRLSTKQALIGFLQTQPNHLLTELAALCGYDFIVLDGEHGVFCDADYLHALQILAATDTICMVRLREHDGRALGRYLDMGVDTIVVPNVATAEQARSLVRAMDYPPAGSRGFGAAVHRATCYGMDLTAHLQAPRAEASLIVIIESSLGVTNVDDILAVEGVDGVVIGPFDLSADLGYPGNFSFPEYSSAVASIERAAAKGGKWLGTAPHGDLSLEALLARGYDLCIVGSDVSLIREAMSAQVAAAHRLRAS